MSRTVTKEQLKKSGFGSLRDFMNANKYDADKGKYVKEKRLLNVKMVNLLQRLKRKQQVLAVLYLLKIKQVEVQTHLKLEQAT